VDNKEVTIVTSIGISVRGITEDNDGDDVKPALAVTGQG
jgi:hypothetical protein